MIRYTEINVSSKIHKINATQIYARKKCLFFADIKCLFFFRLVFGEVSNKSGGGQVN